MMIVVYLDRYVATAVTSVHEMENGFTIWSFNGKLLYRNLKDHFFQVCNKNKTGLTILRLMSETVIVFHVYSWHGAQDLHHSCLQRRKKR